MSLKLGDTNKETIKQVFNLKAEVSLILSKIQDGRLSKQGLRDIFEMIGYEISEDEMKEITEMLFAKRETITFSNFLDLFKLQLNDLTKDDIKSAFKVLARDDDQHIPLSLLKEIIDENSGLNETDSFFLVNQIMQYANQNQEVNFVNLLENFDIK